MIQNKVDALCRNYPDMDRYCNREGEEPFFVKNFENVQGDERDVMLLYRLDMVRQSDAVVEKFGRIF